MAAYAALASLMNNIELMMSHPRLSISFDKKQIETLLGKADELLQFLNNNNHGGVVSKEAEDLERQITSAAYLAEDVIETHMVDQILLSSTDEQKETIQDLERQIASEAHSAEDMIESHIVDQMHAGSNQASLGSPLDLQQKIEDMDAILKKAAEVKEKWRVREEQPTDSGGNDKEKDTEKQPHTTGEASSSSVGLEEEVKQVVDKLTLNQPERHIISIVGMGGTGKTTLAQNVYQNPCIKHHFDFRAWATVSQKHDVREILSQLLSSLGSVGESGEQLHETLWGRRYLIVLDDIWSVKAWDEVRRFFPDDRNGSRVVLTTRLSNLVTESGSTSCFPMKLLDEQKSWALFWTKAFKQENCPNPELENVGKKIARLCKGLPLSLVVIGGLLLKSPKTVGFTPSTDRRLVYYGYLDQIGSQLARSIMLRSYLMQSIKCKLLRILDDDYDCSPEELYVNVNLRYLAYMPMGYYQHECKIPTSVSLLWNLQTLIINDNSMTLVTVAPTEIWQMRQLRHVKCPMMYLPDPPPSNRQDYLENLQTLTAAINLRLSEEVCEIIPNINKLHLIYDPELHGYNDSLVECLFYLDRLHRLKSLNMQIVGINLYMSLDLKSTFCVDQFSVFMCSNPLWDE